MKESDWLHVKLDSDWPAGTTIDAISFYTDAAKTSELGLWTATGGNSAGLNGIFACSYADPDIKAEVTIEDTEDLAKGATKDCWFSASGPIVGSSPPKQWTVDPELINKGKN